LNKIKDYENYNSSMKKSLLDKIFFIDKIEEVDYIVDYGCADGTLIKFLNNLFPDYKYLGYDIDPKMIELSNSQNECDNIYFCDNWEAIERIIKDKKSCVILSSVIHEVYAYGTRKDVDVLWKRVFEDGFDYIVVRDMIPSSTIDKRADINDVSNILKKANKNHLFEFERKWGSIENNKNLIHFLLKYRYTENWVREVNENYFPLLREEFLSSIPNNYEIDFHEHFVLPFFKNSVFKDFGIRIKDNTHFKIILKKEN